MALSKFKIGTIIEVLSQKCNIPNLSVDDVSGINSDKEFFEPAKAVGNDTSNYKIVPPNYFACNLMHVGRDVVLPIALNCTNNDKIVSPAYTVFKLIDEHTVLKEYFFMMLNSKEMDRFFWFNTDSSVREGLPWETFCNIELQVPSLEIQQKYVNVYKAMVANQKVYEKSLDDLKLVCDVYIENLPNREKIGNRLIEVQRKNNGGKITVEKGVSIAKKFIDTKSSASNIETQKVVDVGEFAFNSNTSRNSDTLSIALNHDEPYIVSNTYVVCKPDSTVLLPEYLLLWFCRSEFDRYARFNSWGSARETISIKEIQEYKIAIPDLNIQQAIIDIHKVYMAKKEINEKLKAQIKNICPILIQGALQEGRKEES